MCHLILFHTLCWGLILGYAEYMSDSNSQMYSEVVETQMAEKQPVNPEIAPEEQSAATPTGGEDGHGRSGMKVFGLFIVGVLLFGAAMVESYVA